MYKKIALISGASRGIGKAIALKLASNGIGVGVGYKNQFDKAQECVTEINKLGGKSVAIKIDVTNRDSIKEAIQEVEYSIGKINILINNAAIAQEKSYLDIENHDFDEMINTNLRGPFICIQETLPYMIDIKWGRIVNIASIGGQWGGVNQIHYASAKAGLIGLTKSIAKTFSASGITTNAISPGLVSTDMSANEISSKEGVEKMKHIPIGRLGLREEIASAADFLVSNDAGYITGQTVNVNGGMYFG